MPFKNNNVPQTGVTITNINLLLKIESTYFKQLPLFEGHLSLNGIVQEKQCCNLQVCTLSEMAAKESMKFSNATKITYFCHIKMPLTSVI